MKEENFRYFEFGEFRIDTRRRILLKNGETLPLSPRNFELLVALIENEGRILTHDELLDKVWEGTFVEQANLKNAISVLRKILGEHPNESVYIKTIPRRGYSFVAHVKQLPDENEILEIHQTQSEIVIEEEIIEDDEKFVPPQTITNQLLPPAPNKRLFDPPRKLIFGAVTFSVLLLGLLGYGMWKLVAKNPPRFSVENTKITRLSSLGNLNGAVVSPDGKYFLYATVDNDGSSLWVKQIATGGATRLTAKMQASFWHYTFSPDSSYIFYTIDNNSDNSQNGLFKIPLFGGSPQRISENSLGILFSPEGNQISFIRSTNGKTQVFVANPDFSDEKPITTLSEEHRVWSLNWSPDGRNLLLAIRKYEADKIIHYVAEFPTDGSKEKIIVPEMEKQITSAIWLPDKSSLLVCLREVNAEFRQIWQYFPSNREFRRVTNDDNSYRGLTMTRDGKTIVTATENRYASIWTADDEKFNLKQITSGASGFDKIAWTADGRLIYSLGENKVESIYIINSDGSQSRQITNGEDGIWLLPRVSGDGKSALFVCSRKGRKQLCREDLEGRNLIQLTQTGEISIFNGKLLSDNQTLIFQGDVPGRAGILFRQAIDGTVSRLVDEDTNAWDLSADEKLLAYSATDPQTRKGRIFIKDLDSGEIIKTFDFQPFKQIRWTPGGKALTYDTRIGGSSEIRLQPIAGGEPKILASFPGEQIFSFDWSFDGKKLVIIRGKQLTDAVSIKLEEQSN